MVQVSKSVADLIRCKFRLSLLLVLKGSNTAHHLSWFARGSLPILKTHFFFLTCCHNLFRPSFRFEGFLEHLVEFVPRFIMKSESYLARQFRVSRYVTSLMDVCVQINNVWRCFVQLVQY